MQYLLIILGALLRILPHQPNFTPIGAMALFGGAKLGKFALILPLLAMLLADLYLGFYNPWLMASVYGSFLLTGLLGLWLKKNYCFTNVLGASLLGSIIFFLVTNFTMWAIQPMMPQAIYPQTWQGLLDCYIMGLPFFRNTILGDLFYSGAMFGVFELAQIVSKKIAAKKEANGLGTNRMAGKRI